ncbi:MAG: PKD domain-containing protein [Flavobacteriales bacterium]|nr:PKD domain-containing protein [Flavobacteriales bacterium]
MMNFTWLFKPAMLALLIFSALFSQSQEWVDLLLQPNSNYYEIKAKFDKEWDGKDYERGKGWKQFHRWESFWETRVMEDGSFPMYSPVWDDFKQLLLGPQTKSGGIGNWQPLGPFSITNTDSWSPGTGRVNCVVEDPNNSNILYVGTPAGGIWKSTDAGTTWVPLGDELSVIGVSGITVDPSNSNIIYLCTGDSDGGDVYSIGLMKSTDGGASWNSIGGITANETTEIIIDPTNSNILYLASSSGVYKSTNAGTSWTNVRTGNIRDIEMKPGTPSTLYAVTGSTFYVSTNSGGTWNTVTSALPGSSGRLAIATTAANSSYVYVLSATTGGAFQGLYRSTNSAGSFTAMNTTTDIFQSTQSWYDMALAASQTNANEIVTGVMNVWKSTNGGSSFTQLNNWSSPGGAAYTHADIHYLKYYGGNLYCGSDGGVYKSTNSGNSFTDITTGLQIGQFYRIGGSQNDVNTLAGGLQDNGGFAWKSGQWKVYYGADGMEAGVDRLNSNLIFGMIQYGDLYRSTNGANTSSGVGSPESGRWVTPMAMDPNNNRLLAGYSDLYEFDYGSGWNQISTFNFPQQLRNIEIYEGNSNTIFVSTDDNIYRTANGGTAFTDITGSLPTNSIITSIEVNPTNSNELWITRGGWTSGQHVYHTTDGGTTWNNITANLPNLPTNIIKHDAGTNGGVYVGTDLGVYFYDNVLTTWLQYMGNLPNVIVNDLEINENASVIRAGTYGRGVWESPNYNISDYDASISDVVSPIASICNESTIDPVVTLFNLGSITLTTVTINYDIDGGSALTYNWTGSLVQGASENVTLPTMIVASGAHIFNVSTSNPNGQADQNTGNDANAKPFSISLSGNALTLNLTTDCWGSETTWEIKDSNSITVASGGPYGDVTGGQLQTELMCLPDGCYDFTINDSYGDGVFGSQWGSCTVDGDYTILDDTGAVYVQMLSADFGTTTTHSFCVIGTLLTPNFTANTTTICAGETVDFTDASTDGTPTGWVWSFAGAASTTSSLENPTGIRYNSAGTYTVELTVTDASGSYTQTLTNFITVTANPTVTSSPTNALCGLNNGSVTAVGSGGTGALSYSWSNGGSGATISGLGAGNYTVTVTDANGCSSAILTNITNSPVPSVSATPSDAVCGLDNGAATAVGSGGTGTLSYSWSNGDSGATITGLAVGTYTVTVTDANGCSSDYTTSVSDLGGPTATVTGDQIICLGTSVNLIAVGAGVGGSYSWDNGLGIGSAQIASPSSTTTYNVTVTDVNGCTSIVSTVVTVSIPSVIINASGSSTICDGSSISISASGASTFTWDNGLGGGSSHSVTPTSSTTYNVVGTDGFGCTGTGSITITVVPNPIVSVTPVSGTICEGDNLTLSASGASTYSWDGGLGSGGNQTVSPIATTTYHVTGTDGLGCIGTDSVTVTVLVNPTVIITPSGMTICEGESVTITASGASSFSWDTGANTASITESPTVTSTYTVTGTTGSCNSTPVNVIITVEPLPIAIAGADFTSIVVGGNVNFNNSGSTG